MAYGLQRALIAEAVGTFFLLATVVGSGIMAETLSGGNVGLALLANAVATGAILVVLILMFGPISGAHFNPAVTLAFRILGEIDSSRAALFVVAQIVGGLLGVIAANLMFSLPAVTLSETARTGSGQWLGEAVATFGLVSVILLVRAARADAVALSVGLYITAAYFFTSSTSFANPAVTLARMVSNTFAGIRPLDGPVFIVIQLIGAAVAVAFCRFLLADNKEGTG